MAYTDGLPSPLSEPLVVEMFTLTMSQEGSGTIVPAVGEHQYMEGRAVILAALPSVGFIFVKWDGDQVEDQNNPSTMVIMDDYKSITAIFKEAVTLTIIATGGGSTTPPSGVITAYEKGSYATIKAAPIDKYEFKAWSGDLVGTSDTESVLMDANKVIACSFGRITEAGNAKAKLYYATDTKKAYWNVDSQWVYFATIRHSLMLELGDDGHPQYLTNERHDIDSRHSLGTVVPHDSHTALSNIGTHTHSDIDGHLDSTSNPHTVTAAQVGAIPAASSSSLPAADAAHRDTFFTVLGTETPAVADKLYWCRSTDGGTTYEWKEITLA